MPIVGTLVAIQSYCLYSAVARLPVALALLAFNTYPLWAAFWARIIYRHQAEKFVLRAMPVILFGLALALDVLGAASGLGASAHWQQIGTGVAFAITAAATFALAMVLTQHEALAVDGRIRTAFTLSMVLLLTSLFAASTGDWSLPKTATGWWGLAGLTVLYGTAFTLMFSLLPRLGVVGNSAIMNVEPAAGSIDRARAGPGRAHCGHDRDGARPAQAGGLIRRQRTRPADPWPSPHCPA
jgi:drug/metabolite transporter (DMT)-like permease